MKTSDVRHRSSQAGFGLIEIMIALTLGVIIMLGVSQIATNNSRTTYELDRVGRQIENATYTLRLLEGEIKNAAYWGERRDTDIGSIPPLCPDIACSPATFLVTPDDPSCELNWAMAYPLQGASTTAEPNFSCPTALIVPKLNTDYLAIRRASSCAFGDANCATFDGNYHLQVDACYNKDKPENSERVIISGIEGELVYQNRDCSTTAPIYRFLNRIFYVNADDQLVRADLVNTGGTTFGYIETPLVDDIEMLRFEYGLDTNGDGQEDLPAPDDLTLASDPRWINVIRVTIHLVARSASPSAGFTDERIYTTAGVDTYCASDAGSCTATIPAEFTNHKRQLYTRTVSLRNVVGRRR